jgi:hypothetical protein
MFSKILAPIITPNATAGTMNLSAVFTRVEVLKTFTPPFHHNHQTSPIQRDKVVQHPLRFDQTLRYVIKQVSY